MAEKFSFTTDIFDRFAYKWAMVGAGPMGEHNAMTIAWGGMGTLWGRPVVTVYVNHDRYTYEFMEKNDYFMVSIYPEECKEALQIMGSKSGRDCDKPALAGLTPVEIEHGVTFAEAEKTFVCRKIYAADLVAEGADPEIFERMYIANARGLHKMYIGEVVEIIEK